MIDCEDCSRTLVSRPVQWKNLYEQKGFEAILNSPCLLLCSHSTCMLTVLVKNGNPVQIQKSTHEDSYGESRTAARKLFRQLNAVVSLRTSLFVSWRFDNLRYHTHLSSDGSYDVCCHHERFVYPCGSLRTAAWRARDETSTFRSSLHCMFEAQNEGTRPFPVNAQTHHNYVTQLRYLHTGISLAFSTLPLFKGHFT